MLCAVHSLVNCHANPLTSAMHVSVCGVCSINTLQVVGVVEAGNWRQLCAVVRLEQLGCTTLLPFTHLRPSQQAQVCMLHS
jgi:hypothetical protein